MTSETAPKKPAGSSKAKRKSEVEAEAKAKAAESESSDEEVSEGEAEDSDAQLAQEAEQASDDVDNVIDIFDYKEDIKRWCIGKPPEQGGSEDEYAYYTQRPLGHIQRARFFGLVTRTIANAIKEGGATDLGFGDVFGAGGGSIRQRAANLAQQDLTDASSFMAMAFTLMSYTPDFLLDCYVIWLDVPAQTGERIWAKQVMAQNYNPDEDHWGITDDMAFEMAERFIDQNYEEIRAFFVERVPQTVARARQREREHQERKRKGSDSSKQ